MNLLVLAKKVFERFLPFIGHAGHLGYVNQIPRTNICYPYLWRLSMKYLALIVLPVMDKKIFLNGERTTTDGRRRLWFMYYQ